MVPWPAETLRLAERGVVVVAMQQVARAVLAHSGNFDQRREQRHDDGRGDVQPLAVKRQGHAVIAGAGGDHAAPAFFGAEREQTIERAAFFERSGDLKIFQFAKNPAAGHTAEVFRIGQWREIDLILDALARFFDVDKADHGRARVE